MHKHLNDKAFLAAEKEKNAEEARKLFLEAWDKAIGEKNAEGKSYGDIIKSGKLPGKNGMAPRASFSKVGGSSGATVAPD